jgi:hypothetical protein
MHWRFSRPIVAVALLLIACRSATADTISTIASPAIPASLAPLPKGWPDTFELGMEDSPGGAASMQETAPFGFRYQYLAGGVNTGRGWATWDPDGSFVTSYIQESTASAMIPVFSYYQLRQSAPNSKFPDGQAIAYNLQNTATMAAYFTDLKLFFQRAGAFQPTLVILHVEPDLWGFIEEAAKQDDAASVPVQVAATGLPELRLYPNNAAGLAQAILFLRDSYAPNVLVAYHLSTWGTGTSLLAAQPVGVVAKIEAKLGAKLFGTSFVGRKPSDAAVAALAHRSVAFYDSLDAHFDLSFTEFLDRDSAFYQYVYRNPNAWYTPADYNRHIIYLAAFASGAGQRLVLWQIPYGNTQMRRENNAWDHYQSNQVETLLGDPARNYLITYSRAGVVAMLFGGGGAGSTCACNTSGASAAPDPAPIDGNIRDSLNADDDGGYFREQAAAFYREPADSLSR